MEEKDPPVQVQEKKAQTVLDQADILSKQVTFRKRHKMLTKAADKHSIGIATVAATSALMNPANQETEKLWSKRSIKKVRKNFIPVRVNLETPSHPSVSVPAADRKQVHFHTEEDNISSNPSTRPSQGSEPPSRITDVCSFLNDPVNGELNGYLDLEKDRLVFQNDSSDKGSLDGSYLNSLIKFFAATPKLLDRVRMGVDFVLVIMSLGKSGWIPST